MLMKRHQKGFTLVEMLLAVGISIFIAGALIAIFVANLNHYHKVIEINRLNYRLQSVMQVMVNDIRRAGYWADARNDLGLDQNNNPFMAAGLDVAVNAAGDCITFSYDHNNDGLLPSISASTDDERYGFRLMNGAVQARPPGAALSCTAAAADWENMTNTNLVTVTALTFTLTNRTVTTGPTTQGIVYRSVDITLTGQLSGDATISKTLTQHVRIRNDRFSP